MGYNVARFIVAVDQNLICSICGGVLQDAVLTPCGHSFCTLCLKTWLDRPNTKSCPECRSSLDENEIHPILSVRNLVNSLAIRCENEEHGCDVILKLDNMKTHKLQDCKYEQIKCAGCDVMLNRCELRKHHNACAIIQNILSEERNTMQANKQESLLEPVSTELFDDKTVTDLVSRVSVLELHLKRVRKDLEIADSKNKKMERDLRRTREELEDKRLQLTEYIYIDFDSEYNYGFTRSSIPKLSCFLSRFISCKPMYIDTARVFTAIERCYDNFGHGSACADHDVLMLLTTAYASNWFSRSQRISLNCWLQSLMTSNDFAETGASKPIVTT